MVTKITATVSKVGRHVTAVIKHGNISKTVKLTRAELLLYDDLAAFIEDRVENQKKFRAITSSK